MQVRSLEQSCGLRLFEQKHKALVLTEADRIALEFTNSISGGGEELTDPLQNHANPSHAIIAAEVDDMALLRLMARETNGVTIVLPVVVNKELAAGSPLERHRFPRINESFSAVTLSRRFRNRLDAN